MAVERVFIVSILHREAEFVDCCYFLAMCTMPQESDVCGEYEIKWLFDPSAGLCTRSWDSGCEVDAHRFDSEEACQAACINPPDYGQLFCVLLIDCVSVSERFNLVPAKGR